VPKVDTSVLVTVGYIATDLREVHAERVHVHPVQETREAFIEP